MRRQPKIIAQDGNKRIDRAIKGQGLRVGKNQRDHCHGHSPKQEIAAAIDRFKNQRKKNRAECHPDDRLVHVRDGRASSDGDASGKSRCLQQKSTSCQDPRRGIAAGTKPGS